MSTRTISTLVLSLCFAATLPACDEGKKDAKAADAKKDENKADEKKALANADEKKADDAKGEPEGAEGKSDEMKADGKADDGKADGKADEGKADEGKAGEGKADEGKAGDKKADDKKADDTKTGDAGKGVDGKAVFEKKCKTCHGSDGKAKTKIGEENDIPDWTAAGWKGKWPESKVVDIVTNGKSGTKMKPFKDKLTPGEIAAVSKYARSLGK